MMVNYEIKLFSGVTCELGEGPLWHEQRQSLFWLDILNKTLFEKRLDSGESNYDNTWTLPFTGTALATDSRRQDVLWILTEHSFGEFDLRNGYYKPTINLDIINTHRTNDGGVAPNGHFWFGTMEKKPTGLNGTIYSITPQGKLIQQLNNIGIPNTFCWRDTGQELLIADSFRQLIMSYDVSKGLLQKNSGNIYINLSEQGLSTPDGGAIDQFGRLWNAQWDGYCAACYDDKGELKHRIELPVPKPTSCCFGGPEYQFLFITSAHEGLSVTDREQYPLSGGVFFIKLPFSGMKIPSYQKL